MSLYKRIIKGIPSTIQIPEEMEAIVDWEERSGELIGGLFEFYADENSEDITNWLEMIS